MDISIKQGHLDMRYSNRYQNGGDEVKVAVLADQMRADNHASLSMSNLFLGVSAALLALNFFLVLR
ncbi:hypothetical protein [Leptolyngbya iicbica]|uniref:Uncharacterized protein n=2 Tax=Cyanophyceae TaxID=3028117 RepID=A0A4Q7EHM2_9CYAN|nr:hypothetical protein [Leptolyngbya sp. LK]RZM82843.1 hypothetical protein DYY88_06475 [Leptolyngbya sp. LK]